MKMIRLPIPMIVFVVALLAMPIVASADHAWNNYH
jgi:hypothetical protein